MALESGISTEGSQRPTGIPYTERRGGSRPALRAASGMGRSGSYGAAGEKGRRALPAQASPHLKIQRGGSPQKTARAGLTDRAQGPRCGPQGQPAAGRERGKRGLPLREMDPCWTKGSSRGPHSHLSPEAPAWWEGHCPDPPLGSRWCFGRGCPGCGLGRHVKTSKTFEFKDVRGQRSRAPAALCLTSAPKGKREPKGKQLCPWPHPRPLSLL